MGTPTTPTTPATPQTPQAGDSGQTAAPDSGQPTNTPAGQPQAPNAQPQTPAAGEPYRVFATQAELDTFMVDRANRAKKAGIKELAKELGFEDVDDFRDAIRSIRGPNGGAASGSQNQPGGQSPQQAPAGHSGADLGVKLKVAAKMGLPADLVYRLVGETEEELEADAQSLLTRLNGQNGGAATTAPTTPKGPGIPPTTPNNPPVTLTRSFLAANPAWVRANRAQVEAAAREGRIVDS